MIGTGVGRFLNQPSNAAALTDELPTPADREVPLRQYRTRRSRCDQRHHSGSPHCVIPL